MLEYLRPNLFHVVLVISQGAALRTPELRDPTPPRTLRSLPQVWDLRNELIKVCYDPKVVRPFYQKLHTRAFHSGRAR